MQSNQEAACKANAYARRLIKESYTSNLLSAESQALIAQGNSTRDIEIYKVSERIATMRNSLLNMEHSLIGLFRIFDYCDPFVFEFKNVVTHVKQFSVGNCGEYASLVMNHLRKQAITQAEYFYIIDGDHAFVVIGRQENSNPEDPDTWGPDAVICDAWLDQIYPASMANLTRNMDFFDPQKHRLMFYSSFRDHRIERKEEAIRGAYDKLNVLLTTLMTFIMNEAYQYSVTAEMIDKLASIIYEIQQAMDFLPSIKAAPDFVIQANIVIERQLTKIVLKPLKRFLLLQLEPIIKEKLILTLVDGWYRSFQHWIFTWDQKKPLYLLKDILCRSSETVVVRLLMQLDQSLLEEVLELADTLLYHFIHLNMEKKFHALLIRISAQTLMTVDTPEYVPNIEGKNASLLHFAIQKRGKKTFFLALLEKYTPDALHHICQMPISTEYGDMKLTNLALLYGADSCFIFLMTRLRPDTQKQALDDLEHFPFDEESSEHCRQMLLEFMKKHDKFIHLLNIFTRQNVSITFDTLHFHNDYFRYQLQKNAHHIVDRAMKMALLKRLDELEPYELHYPALHRFSKIFRDVETKHREIQQDLGFSGMSLDPVILEHSIEDAVIAPL